MSYIIWIDEAWRGPWAWPVCAGAVLFLKWPKIRELKKQLDDSKRLSKIKRQAIFDQIVRAENSWFLVFGFWMATNVEIDNIWIKKANKLAILSDIIGFSEVTRVRSVLNKSLNTLKKELKKN